MSFSEEAPLTERQSLDLIQTMIRQAHKRIADDGSHLLLWGWLVFIAALGHYALLQTAYADYGGLMWLLMPVGGVSAVVLGRRQARAQAAGTYLDRVVGFLWGAVGTAIGFVFLLIFLTNTWRVTYPIILMLYGIGLFTTGGVVRFPALVVGAVGCWALAVVAAVVNFEGQLLCMAGAVLAGYIIPGFMLRSAYRRQHASTPAPPDAAPAV